MEDSNSPKNTEKKDNEMKTIKKINVVEKQ